MVTSHPHTPPIVVNHVMSSGVQSSIFTDLIKHFKKYSPNDVAHVVSERRTENASVYHYHRPNLEKIIAPNSIVTVHHDLEDSDPSLEFSAFSHAYRAASKVVCLCSTQKKWLSARGYSNVAIIPHGAQERFYKVQRPLHQPNKVTLGLASRRYGRRVKGEALLSEISKRLSPDELAFFLIGRGRLRDAADLNELGYEVIVHEHLPYRLFPQFYRAIDGLLVLSWYEGGPACIPEAVASGTPLLCTAVGMAVDCLTPDFNGVLLTRDPDLDAAAIQRFVSDVGFRTRLRENAESMKDSAMTWRSVVEQYVSLYRQVAKVA